MISIAININGKEVENPLLKLIIGLAVAGLVVFVILPIIGVVVSFSVGLVILLVPAILIGLPLLVVGSVIFPLLKFLLIGAGIIFLLFFPGIIPGLSVVAIILIVAGLYIMLKK